jgi:hypothetical protein
MLLALFSGWVLTAGTSGLDLAPSGSPAPTVVSPPAVADMPNDCSADVSAPMTAWLASLAPGTEVVVPPSWCYRVDEGVTIKVDDLTINGGTWLNAMVLSTRGKSRGFANFTAGPVTGLTLENMTLDGLNGGGFYPQLYGAAGIRLNGTIDARILDVTISHTFGDGINLEPYRDPRNAGVIINPVENLTVHDVHVQGAGRDGMALISVDNATISHVSIEWPGTGDIFNLEADQANEGAQNLTIDGCWTSPAANFFANVGASNGWSTGGITVENCDIGYSAGAYIVNLINYPHPRGPYTFFHDTFHCNQSVYVPCIADLGADVTVVDSTLSTPAWAPHERLFGVWQGSVLHFTGDSVVGGFKTGVKGPYTQEVGEPYVLPTSSGGGTGTSSAATPDVPPPPPGPGPARPAPSSA